MDRRPGRTADRVEEMALWLEAIELALEAVHAEQQPERRQRALGVLTRAVADARREQWALEHPLQRPQLRLLAGGGTAGGYLAAEPGRVGAVRRTAFTPSAAAVSPSHAG